MSGAREVGDTGAGAVAREEPDVLTHEQTTAVWVGAFFDELVRWGVRDVVVSPGSRSTPLAMVAYELSQQRPDDLRLYVDVDERGAAFFGLGLAKASGRPVAIVCTSGTAAANYYPAVIEAETSRVPLIVLTGDRPPQLQGLGAPQTTDQLKMYGEHVRAFRAMPLPGASARDVAFVRQAAREACLAALGGAAPAVSAETDKEACASTTVGAPAQAHAAADYASGVQADAQVASRACAHAAGPVHLNFPFDEPLKPDFSGVDAFCAGRVSTGCANVDAAQNVSRETSDSDGVSAIPQSANSLQNVSRETIGADQQKPGQQNTDQVQNVSRETFFAELGAFPLMPVHSELDASAALELANLLRTHCTLVLAGEGTCSTLDEAREVVTWAHTWNLPLLADPLSGLRAVDDDLVIDNYDNVFGATDCPLPDLVIRFGRYPVSKRATTRLAQTHTQGMTFIAVDAAETRDFNYATDLFVPMTPLDFVRSFDGGNVQACDDNAAGGADEQTAAAERARADRQAPAPADQQDFARTWIALNDAARARILAVEKADDADQLEGAYLRRLLALAPAYSCIFSASSMSIRALDTFLVKGDRPVCVLCNRGQNGIDGTTSTALGAAQSFAQTTFVTGDLAFLHDLSALAMQRELLKQSNATAEANANAANDADSGAANDANEDVASAGAPSVVIVLFNNNGGAIFDMLPQASDDPYFERLFLTPQDVDFKQVAGAFDVPYQQVSTVEEFGAAYSEQLGVSGISLIEVRTPLRGVKERYSVYQQ